MVDFLDFLKIIIIVKTFVNRVISLHQCMLVCLFYGT